MKFSVYSLIRTGEMLPFYIGASVNPTSRATAHRKKHGPNFRLDVLESFDTAEEAGKREAELIRELQDMGAPLVNCKKAAHYGGIRESWAKLPVRFCVTLRKETAEALARAAKADGRTVSGFLEHYLPGMSSIRRELVS